MWGWLVLPRNYETSQRYQAFCAVSEPYIEMALKIIVFMQLVYYENCIRTGDDGNRPHVLQENLTYHNLAFWPGALYDHWDHSKFFFSWSFAKRFCGVRGLLSKDYKGKKKGDKQSINHKTFRGSSLQIVIFYG